MIRGVQAVKARALPETTFFCLSNSNSVFIDTILKVSTSFLYSWYLALQLATTRFGSLSDQLARFSITNWRTNSSRSSPTPPNSSTTVSCKSSDGSIRTERNTAVKSVAAPTCAKVNPTPSRFIPQSLMLSRVRQVRSWTSLCSDTEDGRSLIESFTSEMEGTISVLCCACARQCSPLASVHSVRAVSLTCIIPTGKTLDLCDRTESCPVELQKRESRAGSSVLWSAGEALGKSSGISSTALLNPIFEKVQPKRKFLANGVRDCTHYQLSSAALVARLSAPIRRLRFPPGDVGLNNLRKSRISLRAFWQ